MGNSWETEEWLAWYEKALEMGRWAKETLDAYYADLIKETEECLRLGAMLGGPDHQLDDKGDEPKGYIIEKFEALDED